MTFFAPPPPGARRRRRRTRRRAPIFARSSVLASRLTLTYTRLGDVTRAIATSALAGAFFFWYVDGAYVGVTRTGQRDFVLQDGAQARIDVLATTDPTFDPIVNGPAGYPARRALWWTRSLDADLDRYLVEQAINGGAYATVALVAQDPLAWTLSWLSARLQDLATYSWRVTPVDAAGNAGAAHVFGPELVVRRPDAPNFTASVAATLVTFASAP